MPINRCPKIKQGPYGTLAFRASLATWLFSFVLNRTHTRASREPCLGGLLGIIDRVQGAERSVDMTEFRPEDHCIERLRLWDLTPPQSRGRAQATLDPCAGRDPAPARRSVRGGHPTRYGGARDGGGLCDAFIGAENRRVLLHGTRGRIRKTIDTPVTGTASAQISAAASARIALWPRRHAPRNRLG